MENNIGDYRLVASVEETNILPIELVGSNVNTFLLGAEKNYAYDKNGNLREVKENKGVDYSSLFEMEERANTLFNHPDNNRMMNHYDDVVAPQRYTSGIRNLAKENRMQAREAKIQNRYRYSQIETKPKEERIGYLNKPVISNKSSHLNFSSSLNNQNEIVMKPKKKEKNYEEIANVFYPDMPEVSQIKTRAKKLMPVNSFASYVSPIEFWGNYKDMKNASVKYSDKYFHSKANCESAQKGDIKGAMMLSFLKEIYDIPKKIIFEGQTYTNTINDSFADIRADLDGLYLGMSNPTVNCKILVDKYRPKGLDEKY